MDNQFKWYEDGNIAASNEPSKKNRNVSLTLMIVLLVVALVAGGVIGIAVGISNKNTSAQQNPGDIAQVPTEDQPDDRPQQQPPTTDTPTKTKPGSEKNNPNPPSSSILDSIAPTLDASQTYSKVEIVRNCAPAVVGIDVTYERASGSGSGVIISSDGYIVTNHHVVSSNTQYVTDAPSKIIVYLSDDTEYEAKLIGSDQRSDLAIIKIEAQNLPYAVMGDSDTAEVGEDVVVIGNPLGILRGTVTSGIVSALSRTVDVESENGSQKMTLMQTDAAISQGNSGGGMFNMHGELIGIINSGFSASISDGLGFAIPVNDAKNVLNDLIDLGYVTGRAYLGVYSKTVTVQTGSNQENISWIDILNGRVATETRVMITEIAEGSAAQKAGLMAGDLILAIDGTSIRENSELSAKIAEYTPGDQAILTIQRDNELQKITVTFGEYTPQ